MESTRVRVLRLTRRIVKGVVRKTDFSKYLRREDFRIFTSRKTQDWRDFKGPPVISILKGKNGVYDVQYNSLKLTITIWFIPKTFLENCKRSKNGKLRKQIIKVNATVCAQDNCASNFLKISAKKRL
jgi:hypothetical protein